MPKKALQTNALLLLVAMIWGSAFVAQRLGMESIGPLLFSGLRFILGALVILPFLLYRRRSGKVDTPFFDLALLRGGFVLGLIVTAGINLQQTGLLYTSVSHAGFITGMYVLMVPLLGLLIGLRIGTGTWLGAILAVTGLYLLTVEEGFRIAGGDWLQLASALCWAVQVLAMGYLAKRHDPLRLAFIQFVTCAALSLAAALLLEPFSLPAIVQAVPSLLYAGILSIGVAFSLQAVALQRAKPAHAAIILSLEGVFAAVAAAVLLGEALSPQGYLGAGLMLCAMLLAQIWPQAKQPATTEEPLPCPGSGPGVLPATATEGSLKP
jgi:drug/metabolite transporter (DMT)-like permease